MPTGNDNPQIVLVKDSYQGRDTLLEISLTSRFHPSAVVDYLEILKWTSETELKSHLTFVFHRFTFWESNIIRT